MLCSLDYSQHYVVLWRICGIGHIQAIDSIYPWATYVNKSQQSAQGG